MFRNKIIVPLLCVVCLNVIGLVALYSSLHQGGSSDVTFFLKQLKWIVISWCVIVIFSNINYRLYFNTVFIIYAFNIILLIAVIFLGKEIMGAQRWFSVFGMNFQPSEFSKFAILLLLARLFSEYSSHQKQHFLKKFIIPLILVGVNTILVFLQPDLGTSMIFIFLFMGMLVIVPSKRKYFFICCIIAIVLFPLIIGQLHDYQKQRLIVFLNPNVDPLGAGYTIIQSKIAIGSGGLWGKGFLSGTQNQFNFLPERHTDFIFTVIAEEFGFVGGMIMLSLFFILILAIHHTSNKVNDSFAQFLCEGIVFFLLFHVFINIGMTMGIVPVVGLPLPFLSYGGSHLMITAALLGIYSNIVQQWKIG